MLEVSTLDIALGGFWICFGFLLLITLHRQSKNLMKLGDQLDESKGVLDECRGHLQMSNVAIREVATFTRMLTHVSSELRKPLDVIAQTAWVIKHKGAEDTVLMERYCDNILSETKRLSESVDSMLAIVEQEAQRAQASASKTFDWVSVGLKRRPAA